MDFPGQGGGLVVEEGGSQNHEQVEARPDRAEPIPRRTPASTSQQLREVYGDVGVGGQGRGGLN